MVVKSGRRWMSVTAVAETVRLVTEGFTSLAAGVTGNRLLRQNVAYAAHNEHC